MTPRIRRTLALLAAVAAATFLVACGDDSDSDTDSEGGLGALVDDTTTSTTAEETTTTTEDASDLRAEYVDALVPQIRDLGTGADLADEEAECFAGAIVDVVGAEEIDAQGVSPQQFASASGGFAGLDLDLPADAAETLADEMSDCFDAQAVFLEALSADAPAGVDVACMFDTVEEGEVELLLARALVEDSDAYAMGEQFGMSLFGSMSPECAEQVLLQWLVSDGTITEAQAECLANELDDDVAVSLFAAVANPTGQADPAATQALAEAGTACGVAS